MSTPANDRIGLVPRSGSFYPSARRPFRVMAGFIPAIHVLPGDGWALLRGMPGSSPGMTSVGEVRSERLRTGQTECE